MLFEITLVAAMLGAGDAQVDTLDKQQHRGALVAWSDEEITIEGAGGKETYPLAKLVAVRPTATPAKSSATPGVWLELVDGSSLIGASYTASQGKVLLKLLDGSVATIPTSAILAARFKSQDAKIAEQWAKVRQAKPTGDLIVIRKNDAIDFLEGIIGEVNDEVVKFKLDGDEVPVKRGKIEGLIYFHAALPQFGEVRCVVRDGDGLELQTQSVRLADDRLELVSIGGVKLQRPWAAITQVDYTSGKVLYLSDMNSESVRWSPYFSLPKTAAGLQRAGLPQNDRSFDGGPLKLGGRDYAKGVALRSRTELVYRLPEKFRTFAATAGIDDRVRASGSVRLVISGDDKVLHEAMLTGADKPVELELAIQGVKRLKILVDYGDDIDVADYLNLCEARISK